MADITTSGTGNGLMMLIASTMSGSGDSTSPDVMDGALSAIIGQALTANNFHTSNTVAIKDIPSSGVQISNQADDYVYAEYPIKQNREYRLKVKANSFGYDTTVQVAAVIDSVAVAVFLFIHDQDEGSIRVYLDGAIIHDDVLAVPVPEVSATFMNTSVSEICHVGIGSSSDPANPWVLDIVLEEVPAPAASMRTVATQAYTVDVVAVSHAWPPHVDPTDYTALEGGGYKSHPPVIVPKNQFNHVIAYTYTAEDPVVRVETWNYLNGFLRDKTGAGDGVNPFPIQNGDFGSHSMQMTTDLVGQWRSVTTLTYQSGRTEVIEHEYEITGDPGANFADEQLYIGGMPVPEYSDDWQAIADIYDGQDEARRAAAQSRADSAPVRPTVLTHPFDFPLNQATSPQELVDALAIAQTGKTAGDAGISQFEALAATNPVQAALNEMNYYLSIVGTWAALADSATNPNLRAVAARMRTITENFANDSRLAHNGVVSFDQADEQWALYQQYMIYFEKQPAQDVVDMHTWHLVLGAPQ